MVVEDRATRSTEAGGPQAKRSGGVSAANVRDTTLCPWKTKQPVTTEPAAIYMSEKDYSAGTIMIWMKFS